MYVLMSLSSLFYYINRLAVKSNLLMALNKTFLNCNELYHLFIRTNYIMILDYLDRVLGFFSVTDIQRNSWSFLWDYTWNYSLFFSNNYYYTISNCKFLMVLNWGPLPKYWNSSSDLPETSLTLINFSLVHSHLVYASSIWVPIKAVVRILHKFLRCAGFRMDLNFFHSQFNFVFSLISLNVKSLQEQKLLDNLRFSKVSLTILRSSAFLNSILL